MPHSQLTEGWCSCGALTPTRDTPEGPACVAVDRKGPAGAVVGDELALDALRGSAEAGSEMLCEVDDLSFTEAPAALVVSFGSMQCSQSQQRQAVRREARNQCELDFQEDGASLQCP